VDSAELRAAEAQQRLKDFGESHQELRAKTVLPSAADAFDEVRCLPAMSAAVEPAAAHLDNQPKKAAPTHIVLCVFCFWPL
jgi:hypothetical protein